MKKVFLSHEELYNLIDNDILIIALGHKLIDNNLYKVVEYGINDIGYIAYIPVNTMDELSII